MSFDRPTYMKEYNHKYYLANRERILQYSSRYNREHPEQRREINRRYRIANRAKIAEINRNWKERNPKKVREIDRRHYQRHPEKRAEWHKAHPEKQRESNRKYIERNPQKRNAWIKAQYIPLDNKCEECGSTEDLEHHHPDYSKPLEVLTLCRSCHSKLRRID